MRRAAQLSIAVAASLAFASGCSNANSAQPIDLIGTYRLVLRELPNGELLEPPRICGQLDFSARCRNFNVFWRDSEGRPFSMSMISNYDVDADSYDETALYFSEFDGVTGAGVRFDLDRAHGSSKLERRDGRVSFQLPLYGEPRITLRDEGFTATRAGEFVDHWVRVDRSSDSRAEHAP